MAQPNYDHLKIEHQICFPLYAASREVIKRYRPYLDALDLTYTQYITLMVLWEREAVSVKELGQVLYLDSGTLTPVLKSLEQKGYVTRSRSQEDERVVVARITEKGLSLREKAAAIPGQIAGCVRLEGKDALELYRLLHQVLDALKEE